MTPNHVKLGSTITFMKYLASVVSLIFQPKTLIWNKIMLQASNSPNLAKLVVNEPMKSIYKEIYQYFFLFGLLLLHVKISRAYN